MTLVQPEPEDERLLTRHCHGWASHHIPLEMCLFVFVFNRLFIHSFVKPWETPSNPPRGIGDYTSNVDTWHLLLPGVQRQAIALIQALTSLENAEALSPRNELAMSPFSLSLSPSDSCPSVKRQRIKSCACPTNYCLRCAAIVRPITIQGFGSAPGPLTSVGAILFFFDCDPESSFSLSLNSLFEPATLPVVLRGVSGGVVIGTPVTLPEFVAVSPGTLPARSVGGPAGGAADACVMTDEVELDLAGDDGR